MTPILEYKFSAIIPAVLGVALFAFATAARADSMLGQAIPRGGIASVYNGGRTANGEHATGQSLTAAHRTLPFGTRVKVTNTANNRSVVVRINDRGPFVKGRIIDLTHAGASMLGFSGLAHVILEVVSR